LLGTDRIGHWEHILVDRFWQIIELPFPNIRGEGKQSVEIAGVGKTVEAYGEVDSQSNEVGIAGYDHGVKEAEKRNTSAEASKYYPRAETTRQSAARVHSFVSELTSGGVVGIWTQLALAYAIHKSFIFIRVPLTAALTPKVVRVLRGWGWNIGKRKPKAVKSTKD